MNREIKFRGKVKYNGNHKFSGDWIYGYYRNNENGNAFITETLDEYSNYIFDETEVNKDTVGQYTGLEDKKQSRIYEGDYLERKFDIATSGVVEFRRGVFGVRGKDGKFREINLLTDEVIGNIYDNPELIEKEGK